MNIDPDDSYDLIRCGDARGRDGVRGRTPTPVRSSNAPHTRPMDPQELALRTNVQRAYAKSPQHLIETMECECQAHLDLASAQLAWETFRASRREEQPVQTQTQEVPSC